MEAVDKVSSEVDKVINKFSAISEHASKVLSAEQSSLELLKATLLERKLQYNFRTVLMPKVVFFRATRQPADSPADQHD